LTPKGIFAKFCYSHLSFPARQLRNIYTALTENDIAEQMQNQLECQRNKSVELAETLLEVIKSTLESGDDLLVSGFGKFCVKDKAERKGRNPATGDAMMLPSRRIVTFKCSGKLWEKVNADKISTNYVNI
jgi:integration host factor subunit alpha